MNNDYDDGDDAYLTGTFRLPIGDSDWGSKQSAPPATSDQQSASTLCPIECVHPTTVTSAGDRDHYSGPECGGGLYLTDSQIGSGEGMIGSDRVQHLVPGVGGV